MNKSIERLLYGARWLLVPIYFGLAIMLLLISVKFYTEVFHLMHGLISVTESSFVLTLLSLIDLTLVGGLIVMIMLSSYENFIAKFSALPSVKMLSWLGKLDANSLKLKVAGSIVAISSIHLLQIFMNADKIANDKLMWYTLIHLAFVVSAFAMGYLDKMNRPTESRG